MSCTIASTIANEFGESVDPLHKSSLLALGFVLFFFTLILNIIALRIVKRYREQYD